MVSFRLSMWNFHNWFQIRNISHVFSISSNEAAIRGVRLQSDLPNEKGFAIVSETQVQEYRSVLSYGKTVFISILCQSLKRWMKSIIYSPSTSTGYRL